MEHEKRAIRRSPVEPGPGAAAGGGGASGGQVMSQVRGWSDVAREARQRCEHGDEAVRKLRLRRNRSGQ